MLFLRSSRQARYSAAYTLLELLVTFAILATLAGLAVVNVLPLFAESKRSTAVQDIKSIERAIALYQIDHGHLPARLEDAMDPVPTDPWGQPYQYLRIADGGPADGPGKSGGGKGKGKGKGDDQGQGGCGGKGKFRKDRFLVPINSDYDLYSMGPDGASRAPLTAAASRDDIIRGNNGSFIGPASAF